MKTHFLETPHGGFEYTLERRPRRRTLAIRVKPDGQVLVAVPPLVPHLFVKGFLRDKSAWVHRKLADVTRLHRQLATRTYADGDAVPYLGEDYHLRLVARSRLDDADRELHLGVRGKPEREAVIASLTRWYKKQALAVMQERVALLAGRLGREPSHIGIKSYRTRWGSCHPDGRVYFNWRLVMAPLDVVDYVVAHELCHLLHPNHSPAFWNEVGRLYPCYREQRSWLKKHGRLLDL